MKTVLYVLICQGFLGCFDVFWNHEWKENLPHTLSATQEQAIHGVRELLYAAIFIGLAWFSWNGLWAWAMFGLLAVEIFLTAWDFIVEDKTRILSPNERVLHLMLSMGGGAYVALLLPELLRWSQQPTGLARADYGILSWILTMLGTGVFIWGVRDCISSMRLNQRRGEQVSPAISAN